MILLFAILGFAAAYAGTALGQFFATPVGDNSSEGAEQQLEPVIHKSKYNVLLMGTDASGNLTDVIMIYQIDPKNNKVTVLSVPRDTEITYNGRREKINAVHSYGQQKVDSGGSKRGDEYAIKEIREFTGIPIHHYVCINFAAFRQIIDALDGFDFDVPQDMNYDDDWQDLHIHLKKGFQHLDGDKAEQLVRFRSYPDGDIQRVKVQQEALRALIEQKANIVNVTKVPEIFNIILDNINTDMTGAEALGMAYNILYANGNEDMLTTEVVPGTFWNDAQGISYWRPDTKGLEKLVEDKFGYVDGLPVANETDETKNEE